MVLGIAGGMGPYATALFYKKLTEMTCASSDQEHVECIICSAVQIPDRTAFLTGVSEISPLDKIIETCRILEKNTDVIAIPCMTSHHFYDDIASAVSLPVLDMQQICAEEASVTTLGIMATEGTLISGRLIRILRKHGVEPVLPSNQEDVTKLIYDVKAGKPDNMELFRRVVCEMADKGAHKILLACSEFQVYAELTDDRTRSLSKLPPLLDAAELLARRCIEAVGGKVK